MDITASANTLPAWLILIALIVPLVISLIGLIGSRKKADKAELKIFNDSLTVKIVEFEKRLKKCERIRDFLLDKAGDETKKGLEIYLKLSEE